MKENAGSRIPAFTKAESKIVKGSFDFIGIIHYLTASIKDNSRSLAEEHRDYTADAAVTIAGTTCIRRYSSLFYLDFNRADKVIND